ncbi:dipeptidase [Sulfoacidibacillus thermotolerans]|uniref:Membrane dipeptidase n=1 Tax=Sulfoacidibacillus thermotolerans TaxID=1765684 RepID=A0A2U3DAD1_SULT2|nr:dipeptidase [Sulfoacidibacillus thermotolerans]PWI58248.1 hypothetical protein BM613_04795 [Sulfoacidibacillus thermotolerans]
MYRGKFIVDGHADILYRMGKEKLSFYDDNALHQNYKHLRQSGVDVQVFVTFIEPEITASEQLFAVFDSLDRFHREVERADAVQAVYTVAELHRVLQSGRKAAILSLEGADALNGRISVLHALFQSGIRLMGLTWNGANCVADGVGEGRGAGLTQFGREVVKTMRSLGMIVDVSHLAARGVWDVLDLYDGPVVASHSNAMSVFAHRRNLTDDQIRAIAASGGVIGATFVPAFIGASDVLTIEDLIKHIDHLLTVAGEDAVALGSDFDGIESTLVDLRNGSDYTGLLEKIELRYGENVFSKIAGGNWLRVFEQVLPKF